MTDKPQNLTPIVICMGSQSDWPTMQAAKTILDAVDVAVMSKLSLAHRTPDRLTAFAKGAVKNGIQVIIAGAGGAAHLPGMIAAHTNVPVLGVPVESKTLKGIDSLLSIVQMPYGVPVGTLAIGTAGAKNAGLLAAQILALSDKALQGRLDKWRTAQTNAVLNDPRYQTIRTGMIFYDGIKNHRDFEAGQLGRMTAVAAAQMGIRAHIFAPDSKDSPAAEVAQTFTQANYDNEDALAAFGRSIDAVTSEFENVPAATMDLLDAFCPVSPGRDALHLAQNRLREKTLAARLGIQTPSFWAVRSADDLAPSALSDLKGRGVLKTTEQGYDGKGQILIATGDDATSCWRDVNTNEAILDPSSILQLRVSFLVWRDARGQTGVFPAARNIHKNGILATSIGPADGLDPATLKDGADAAISLAEAINLHGVMAMESFVSHTGQIIFNEIAPRPHNSFHWTIEGCVTSQFAQLVRIISGLGPEATPLPAAAGRWTIFWVRICTACLLFMLMQAKLFISMVRMKRAAAAKWDMSPGSCGKST